MRNIYKVVIALATLIALVKPAQADVNVFACEPEWGALAQELGGKLVSVYNATTALQDPHQIQARPGLIAKLRQADLLACTGSELEIGWLPVLLRQGGNSHVQPGQSGYFMATEHVEMLEVPSSVDRSQGDVHAGGNPHIQTDPRNIGKVAKAMADTLQGIDSKHATEYAARYQAFDQRWQASITRWEKEAAPLRGIKVVVHHKSWVYLFNWLGIEEVATLEPKPGVPASAGHLSQLLETLQKQPAKMIIRTAYEEDRPSLWLSDRSHIPAVNLPFTVGGSDGAKDLTGLYDDTLSKLLSAAK